MLWWLQGALAPELLSLPGAWAENSVVQNTAWNEKQESQAGLPGQQHRGHRESLGVAAEVGGGEGRCKIREAKSSVTEHGPRQDGQRDSW